MKFFLILVFLYVTGWGESIKALQLHTDAIDSMVMDNDKLYTASFDGHIKQLDLKTGKIQVIGKISDWIRSLVIKDGLIISGDNQGYIRAWSQNGKLQWEIKAHDWWITDMALWNNTLITVSMDEYVKVWDIEKRKLLFSKKVYGSNKHQSVCIENERSAYIGSTAIISNLKFQKGEFSVQQVVDNGLSRVHLSCVSTRDTVAFGLSDGQVFLNKDFLNVHKKAIKAMAVDSRMLYTASEDGSIKRFNLEKPAEVETLYKGNIPIWSLIVAKHFTYAGCIDGTLKIIPLN